MRLPGGSEWLIILIIVILVFGVGRIGKIAGELGKGIRDFRANLSGENEEEKKEETKARDESEDKG